MDRTFRHLEPFRTIEAPPRGWLRAIRKGLGMTTGQAARRVGVTKSMISKYEKAEIEGTITLATLQKAAQGLNSELIFAVMPARPIEEIRKHQASSVARKRLAAVHNSMTLEDQATSDEELAHLTRQFADELLRERPSELWEDA